ncbi:hypothetical protein EON65_50170, partial [archaeon]
MKHNVLFCLLVLVFLAYSYGAQVIQSTKVSAVQRAGRRLAQQAETQIDPVNSLHSYRRLFALQSAPDPTGQPSTQPSAVPSGQPTAQPSVCPTGQPTAQPSMHPSSRPTRQPSGQPTSEPTRQPTIQPSIQPSRQ